MILGTKNNVLGFDLDLLRAIIDELRNLLNLEIDEFINGTIVIKLKRSNQHVDVKLFREKIEIKMLKLPDESILSTECYSLFNPDFDPVKQICRYVDKALKLEAEYEKKVRESKAILECVL